MNYTNGTVKTINGGAIGSLGNASAGTWTVAKTVTDVLSYHKASGADTAVLLLPLSSFIETNSAADTKIESITFHYSIGTAAVSAVAAEAHIVAFNATTNVPAATTVTLDGTGSETFGKTVASHAITLYPDDDTDLEFGPNEQVNVELSITPVTSTAYTFELNAVTVVYSKVLN